MISNSNSGYGVYVNGSISTGYSCLYVKNSISASNAYAVIIDGDLSGWGGLSVGGSITTTKMNGIKVKEGITSSSDAVNVGGTLTSSNGNGINIGGDVSSTNGNGINIAGNISVLSTSNKPS